MENIIKCEVKELFKYKCFKYKLLFCVKCISHYTTEIIGNTIPSINQFHYY